MKKPQPYPGTKKQRLVDYLGSLEKEPSLKTIIALLHMSESDDAKYGI